MKHVFAVFLILLSFTHANASQSEAQVIGFLEDGRYSVAGQPKAAVLDLPQVRWCFRTVDGAWQAFDQNYEDHLSKSQVVRINRKLATTSCSWHVVSHGKLLGQIQSMGAVSLDERPFWLRPHGMLQYASSPVHTPPLGSRTIEYMSNQGQAVRPPLTLVIKPLYQDPEGWKQVQPVKDLPAEVGEAINALPQKIVLQQEFKDNDFKRPKSQMELERDVIELMMDYPKDTSREKIRRKIKPDDLLLDELWQARDGSRLFGFTFRKGAPEVDLISDPVPNKIYIGWRIGEMPRYLGYTMRLADIGDYDGDHQSEFLFWVYRHDFEGYRMVYQGFRKAAVSILEISH